MNLSQNVTQGPTLPIFFKFTLPNVISLLVLSSSSIVDAMFLGLYAGETPLAAVNIITPIFSLCFGIAIMLTVGGAVRAGKYIGEKDIIKASAIFTKTITAVVVITLIISAIGIFLNEQAASALGANAELEPLSAKYLSIISFFFIFHTVEYTLSTFIRIEGRPTLASLGLISTGAINIILDWIFIGKLGLGVSGAALATGIAGIAGFSLLSTHFITGKSRLKFIFSLKGWQELFLSAYNGISEFISEMSVGIVMMTLNKIMVARFDTMGVAAFTSINYLMWGGGMINYATSDSLTPLISINYGARKPDRVRKFINLAIFFVIGNGLIIFAVLTLIPDKLIGIFIVDKTSGAFDIAMEFSQYVRWAFFFNGINQVMSAYFTAVHRPLESAIVSSSRGLILPLLLLAVLPAIFGNFGIFIAVPVAELATFTIAMFLWSYNKPNKLMNRPKK